MRTKDFPYCCTAHVLVDFGESWVAEGGDKKVKKADIIKYIKKRAKLVSTHAVLTAITNNEQTVANKALRELEFQHNKWMSKKQHPQTKVRLWYKHISDLLE